MPTPSDLVRTYAGARVLVTGGAGFLGSWLCERLITEGATVHCVDSFLTGRRENIDGLLGHPRFTFTQADVTEGIPDGGPVDYVFHLASPASPIHYQRLPLETLRAGSEGTTRALEVATEHGARFLFTSTSEVYGDPEEHPQRESYRGRVDPIGPRSVYDEAKRFGEAVTAAYRRTHGTDTTIARIFNTYGPRMDAHDGRVVPTLMRQAIEGEPLTVAGGGNQTRSLCWVGDTVDGLLRLAASDQPGPINIGNDDERTINELAHLIRELAGSRSAIVRIPLPEGDPAVRRPDLTRARELLGWQPRTPLRTGLSQTLEWFCEQLQPERAGAARATAPAGQAD